MFILQNVGLVGYVYEQAIMMTAMMLLCRFDGYPDKSKDFFMKSSSGLLHPIGWCSRNQKSLLPPAGWLLGFIYWYDGLLICIYGGHVI